MKDFVNLPPAVIGLIAVVKRLVLTHGCSIGDETNCADCRDVRTALDLLATRLAAGVADCNDGGFGEAAYCHHRHHQGDEDIIEHLTGTGSHSTDFDTCPHRICHAARQSAAAGKAGVNDLDAVQAYICTMPAGHRTTRDVLVDVLGFINRRRHGPVCQEKRR